ncbi:bifunctional phosphoribosylaminoimidazolecarboxamide formyltransferase/IMP cyclohydrolase [Melioribacteraceae bacterium 4301-Me]|uniref:bifunctional phosphoribosylaminoimidazolecarboxamide formyltransferase/IMP cyclohydrolase n=1 Tax=Pyranulibacter aquaticus TaxID=3163344 RepID=UPI0035977305
MKKYALISVSDKTKIIDLSKALLKNNYEILATGKTAQLLLENQVKCTEIRDFTSFPEIFSGRVKTLHPKIFGGILMRRDNSEDLKQADENSILPIDIVCVNLYPFPKIVEKNDIPLEEKIENIDIGGPSLIRASAKNYKFVSVLTNPNQYDSFIEELSNGQISEQTRKKLAAEAFSYTAFYDTLIANFFDKEFNLPFRQIRLNYPLETELRYGENPHQKAYLFGNFNNYYEILHGKEVSYNNIIDLIAAVELVYDLGGTSCAIIKHTNPCGAATSDSTFLAYQNALNCDPTSAFGGIVAFNSEVDETTALKLNEIFLEIVCAPSYSDAALEILKSKKNRRIVKIIKEPDKYGLIIKNIPGGLIVQEKDSSRITTEKMNLVTKRSLTDTEIRDLIFAWTVCKHTKSNAIIYAKDRKTLGVGAGQMSRIDSAKIAAMKAKEFGHDLTGAVAASDAFFPFPDGVLEIAANKIVAIIQPGGSVRDSEVIKAAEENNISMVLTGIRNFKH